MRITPQFDAANESHRQLLEENGGGYLNLFVRVDPFGGPIEWVVQNDYEAFQDELWLEGNDVSYLVGLDSLINLPEGIPLDTIEYAEVIGPEPIDDPLDLEWIQLPVIEETFAPGNGGKVSDSDVPALDDPLAREVWGPVEGPPAGSRVRCGRTRILPLLIPGPAEGIDECVPGSHARSLSLIAKTFTCINLGPGGVQGLHDEYVVAMDTNDSNPAILPNDSHPQTIYLRRDDDGNLQTPALNGRNAANEARGWRIDTTQVGPFNVPGWGVADPDLEQNFDGLADRMNEGVDVEFALGWLNGGIHNVTIVQICKYVYWVPFIGEVVRYRVDYVDDDQTKPGVQQKVSRIWVGTDGAFVYDKSSGGPARTGGHVVFYFTDRVIIPEDINGDGNVDAADLGLLLALFGSPFPGQADLNNDGVVNGADMGQLLGKWGTSSSRHQQLSFLRRPLIHRIPGASRSRAPARGARRCFSPHAISRICKNITQL